VHPIQRFKHRGRYKNQKTRVGGPYNKNGVREFPKKVLNGTFHNTRPVGRPRTRWADVVQRDALQLLGVTGWRRRAENRDEWKHALREAKAQKGL
jgi:hypothetical protein